jgi:hypothetical protein
MRAFVNVFVLRQFGPLSAVAVTRLRLTIVGPTRRIKLPVIKLPPAVEDAWARSYSLLLQRRREKPLSSPHNESGCGSFDSCVAAQRASSRIVHPIVQPQVNVSKLYRQCHDSLLHVSFHVWP